MSDPYCPTVAITLVIAAPVPGKVPNPETSSPGETASGTVIVGTGNEVETPAL